MLLDALVARFTHGRHHFDKDARLARRGRAIPALLNELLRDPYLRQPPPKSTGREYYGAAYVQKLLALAKKHRARPADLLRTITLFTALSVVDALHGFVLPKIKIHQLIVSGGGAHNPLIMAQLAAALAPIEVLPSSQLGIPEDAKEAYAFALLAYETWRQRPSNLPNATGATRPAILGKISYAPPR
jgi:anhydro-N-acetylmuramic acid kinase